MNFKHGHSPAGMPPSSTYSTWLAMKQRCANPHNSRYESYGGRGITVCKQWLSFTGFLLSMGERPPGTQIERIDNDGDYEPGNCRWATPLEQAHNRRRPRARRIKVITYGRIIAMARNGCSATEIRQRYEIQRPALFRVMHKGEQRG